MVTPQFNRKKLRDYNNNEDLNNIKERLRSLFDLSGKEVKVYMILLINDKLTATEVSKFAEIQRTRTYEIFRRLREKNLVVLTSENPQCYSVISPRIAIDSLLLKHKELFEEKSSLLLKFLPTLQKLWNDQYEELLSSRVSLISEDLVKEVLPKEIRDANKNLYLAIRDPASEITLSTCTFTRLFDPRYFEIGIQNFSKRGARLHILIGDPELFLKKSHPIMLKTLVQGLAEGTIEVKTINEHFPQSFLLVNDLRVYLFFFNPYQDLYNEAIRAECQGLRDFFKLVWQKFWVDATPLDTEKLLKKIS